MSRCWLYQEQIANICTKRSRIRLLFSQMDFSSKRYPNKATLISDSSGLYFPLDLLQDFLCGSVICDVEQYVSADIYPEFSSSLNKIIQDDAPCF